MILYSDSVILEQGITFVPHRDSRSPYDDPGFPRSGTSAHKGPLHEHAHLSAFCDGDKTSAISNIDWTLSNLRIRDIPEKTNAVGELLNVDTLWILYGISLPRRDNTARPKGSIHPNMQTRIGALRALGRTPWNNNIRFNKLEFSSTSEWHNGGWRDTPEGKAFYYQSKDKTIEDFEGNLIPENTSIENYVEYPLQQAAPGIVYHTQLLKFTSASHPSYHIDGINLNSVIQRYPHLYEFYIMRELVTLEDRDGDSHAANVEFTWADYGTLSQQFVDTQRTRITKKRAPLKMRAAITATYQTEDIVKELRGLDRLGTYIIRPDPVNLPYILFRCRLTQPIQISYSNNMKPAMLIDGRQVVDGGSPGLEQVDYWKRATLYQQGDYVFHDGKGWQCKRRLPGDAKQRRNQPGTRAGKDDWAERPVEKIGGYDIQINVEEL